MIDVQADVKQFVDRGAQNPCWFFSTVLDVQPDYLWPKMREMANSVVNNELTAVQAGHGVSKTYTLGRLALWFLYTHYPSTVLTTAPSQTQVEEQLWREIHSAHMAAKMPLGGKLTTTQLDLQPETGVKWFATGFSTREDTVTKEATRIQGYHNEHFLIIFDEAAGIMPEIWRAGWHIGAPFKRWIACGNATSSKGDFVAALNDKRWNNIKISVKDTPNFLAGKTIIPGVYGKEYEEQIRTRYGEDSDEYKVRVLGEISQKGVAGSYYTAKLNELRKLDRIGLITHNPFYKVHVVSDIGYTSSFWFFQEIGTNVNVIGFYEDSGAALEDYARLFRDWQETKKYAYGEFIVPCDAASNGTKIVTGQSALETFRALGFNARPLPKEIKVIEGIERTRKFMQRCYFSADCQTGIERLEAYHERLNRHLSSDTQLVFTGEPEKDGNDHAADGFRYLSLAFSQGYIHDSTLEPPVTDEKIKQWQQKYKRVG